jgi:hypothetical protein
MPVSPRRRVPARRVRPSIRDPWFTFLLAGQSVNAIGSWASAIVLWGFAAYRFNAGPEAISVTVLCWPWLLTVARDPGLRRVALARVGVMFTSGRSWSWSPCTPGMCWAGRRLSSPCSRRRSESGRS